MTDEPRGQITIEESLAGVLALLATERDDLVRMDASKRKTELILSDAGVTNRTIARVLGKTENAVRMSIRRARAGTARTDSADDGA